MSDVASLELSRELYELSGWELPRIGSAWWYTYPDGSASVYAHERPEHIDEALDKYPAYPLGYLLRKLPAKTQLYKGVNYYTAGIFSGPQAKVKRFNIRNKSMENAACKLAIELFHQGILTKEGV